MTKFEWKKVSESALMAFQVRAICRDHGVVCIRREGKDIEKIIAADDILCENKVCQFMNFSWLFVIGIFTSMNRKVSRGNNILPSYPL